MSVVSADGSPPIPPDTDTDDTDPIVSSNVRLPADLFDKVTATAKAQELTHGELIIVALEHALDTDTLSRHVHPAGTVGGGRFKERGVGAATRVKGTVATLSFSLFQSDLDIITELIAEVRAHSRNHLIAAAFAAYFATPPAAPVVATLTTSTDTEKD